MDSGSKYGHSPLNVVSLPAPSTRDTGFQRDIDSHDQVLCTHCEDQASAFQTPPTSASAWGMEHRMAEADPSGPESGLRSLCNAGSRESVAQRPTYSDSISVRHFEGMNSNNNMGNYSEIGNAPAEATLFAPELTTSNSSYYPGHPQELDHTQLASCDWACLGLPDRDEFTTNELASDASDEPPSGVSSGPWSMDSGSKYGHSPLNVVSLPAPSTRDTGFQRDIDPHDQMLCTHCEDQACVFQTPPSSASTVGMEYRMEEGDPSGSESGTSNSSQYPGHPQELDHTQLASCDWAWLGLPDVDKFTTNELASDAGEEPPSSWPQSRHSGAYSSDEPSNLSPQTGCSGQLSSYSTQSGHSGLVASDELSNVLNAPRDASHAQQQEEDRRASAMRQGGMSCNLSFVLASAMSAGTYPMHMHAWVHVYMQHACAHMQHACACACIMCVCMCALACTCMCTYM